jgi:hypothetical protein
MRLVNDALTVAGVLDNDARDETLLEVWAL